MTSPLSPNTYKPILREKLRARRKLLSSKNPSPNLDRFLPDLLKVRAADIIIAGFSPIGDEINIWPLLKALHSANYRIALPVVIGAERPLIFRNWTPMCEMGTDNFGISYPLGGQGLVPDLVFVPLLGFTASGERLGYGGGYYDRTLAQLRRGGEVFACGVAYAGQEVEHIPTDAHDAPLDGMLTENGFKAYA